MVQNSDVDRLYDLVEKIGVCMLTSRSGRALRARPMHAKLDRETGEISFLTDVRHHKDDEIAADPEVGLAFSASLFHDRYNLSVPRLAPWFDDRQQVIDAIAAQRPDVLAFSALTGTYRWMLGVAAEAKAMLPGVRTVFGGVHASAVPDRVLANPQVDYVCVGEGDLAAFSFCAAIFLRPKIV